MTVRRQLLIFFSIAFAYTWIVMAWMILGHLPIEFGILASCGPTVAALIAHRLATGNYRAFHINVNWSGTLGASLLGPLMIIVGLVVLPAVAVVYPSKLNWRVFASIGVYNYSTLLGGPLFEEPGWRGFALPRLEAQMRPVTAGLFLGAIWAVWHLPMFFYPGWTSLPFWNYFLILIPLSVFMTFGANIARFGVIAPILMHAINNTGNNYFQGLFAAWLPVQAVF